MASANRPARHRGSDAVGAVGPMFHRTAPENLSPVQGSPARFPGWSTKKPGRWRPATGDTNLNLGPLRQRDYGKPIVSVARLSLVASRGQSSERRAEASGPRELEAARRRGQRHAVAGDGGTRVECAHVGRSKRSILLGAKAGVIPACAANLAPFRIFRGVFHGGRVMANPARDVVGAVPILENPHHQHILAVPHQSGPQYRFARGDAKDAAPPDLSTLDLRANDIAASHSDVCAWHTSTTGGASCIAAKYRTHSVSRAPKPRRGKPVAHRACGSPSPRARNPKQRRGGGE